MLNWTIEELKLDLKFTWKIARGSSTSKTIFIIRVSDGDVTGLGEVAGITTQPSEVGQIQTLFKQFADDSPNDLNKLDQLQLPSHLRFGIESAWTHLQANRNLQPVSDYLGRPLTPELLTSFAIPILPPDEIKSFVESFDLQRFQAIKLKVGSSEQAECCKRLAECYSGPIRVDANEAFESAEQVLKFMNAVKGLPIEFVEQPLPASYKEEYLRLKPESIFDVFADESIQNEDITEEHEKMFHGINVKLMKAGGYQRALKQIEQAKALHLKTMLGCMVETSLGIQSAMNIASGVDYFDLDGFLYFKEEPFNLVNESMGKLFLHEACAI